MFHRLRLWDCRLDGDSPGSQDGARNGDRSGQGGRHRYAEAASLLLADDIPSALTRPDDPLTRAQRAAQEELAQIEGHLAAGRYELAKSRLQVQRKVLASLNGHGGPVALLARVDAQIERIAQRQAQEEQLEMQKTCAGFVAQVDQFCTLGDLCQAQTMLEDLTRRLQQYQGPVVAADGRGSDRLARCAGGPLSATRARIEAGPDRRDAGRATAASARESACGWDDPGAAVRVRGPRPVPPSRSGRLDRRLGRAARAARRAPGAVPHAPGLDTLRSDPGSWEQVQDDLVQALELRSGLLAGRGAVIWAHRQ